MRVQSLTTCAHLRSTRRDSLGRALRRLALSRSATIEISFQRVQVHIITILTERLHVFLTVSGYTYGCMMFYSMHMPAVTVIPAYAITTSPSQFDPLLEHANFEGLADIPTK